MKKLNKEQVEVVLNTVMNAIFKKPRSQTSKEFQLLQKHNIRTALEAIGEEEVILHPEPNSKRNWEEDYQYENGNYLNECTYCYKPFLGLKNRTCCKVCYERI